MISWLIKTSFKQSLTPFRLALLACGVALFAGCRSPQKEPQPRGNQSNRTRQNDKRQNDKRQNGTRRNGAPGENTFDARTKTPAINLLLGNPSNAGRDADNYLVLRPQNAMSYNRSIGGPNWVAWHLDKSDLGTARRSEFMPDPLLPADMQIRPSDYRGAGYDRGHVCPSGDRTSSQAYNEGAFTMSNMLPQTPALNQHLWKTLETYERAQTKKNELYIVAGGVGSAGRIARGRVNVPQFCWKILLILPNGSNDLQRIDANTRVIAVLMPNRDTPEIAAGHWSQYLTNVARIEQLTGYKFFSALPANIQSALKQKTDTGRAF